MRLLLAIVLPPLAVLLCGRWVQAGLNLLMLVVALFVPILLVAPVAHAVVVVLQTARDERVRDIARVVAAERQQASSR